MSQETTLPAWLVQAEQIDEKNALLNCATPELLLSTLSLFRGSIPEKAAEIRHYYDSEDWKKYTIKVHALKGTARIVGAKDLAEQAYALELAGKAGDVDTIRRDTDALLAAYEEFLAIIPEAC